MRKVLWSSIAGLSAAAITSQAAPAFRNLDFEEGNTNKVQFIVSSTGIGNPTEILPGWKLYHGTELETSMWVNGGVLDLGYASLASSGNVAPIQGTYSLEIGTARQVPFSIVQQGDIPPDAAFLRYEYSQFPFSLSINGENVNSFSPLPSPWPTGIAPALFDVSKFAGQNVELKLTTVLPVLAAYGVGVLDNIQFLPAPRLEIHQQGGVLYLSWPSSDIAHTLQSTFKLAESNQWKKADAPIASVLGNMTATQAVTGTSGFFRLYLTPLNTPP